MALAVPVLEHPIAAYRKARGISLRTLAKATKIHYVRLHHAEHGRLLDPVELARVARALGVDIAALQPATRADTIAEPHALEQVAS